MKKGAGAQLLKKPFAMILALTSSTLFSGASMSETLETNAAGFNTTSGVGLTPAVILAADDDTLTNTDAAHLAGSTADGGDGLDTLNLTAGGDLTTLSTLLSFEILNLADGFNYTMTGAQHNSFTTIDTPVGSTALIELGSPDGDTNVSGSSNVESYLLNEAYTFTVGHAAQHITGSDSFDQVMVVPNLALTGVINGGIDGTDTLKLENAADLSQATVQNFEILEFPSSGTTSTLSPVQLDSIPTIVIPTPNQDRNVRLSETATLADRVYEGLNFSTLVGGTQVITLTANTADKMQLTAEDTMTDRFIITPSLGDQRIEASDGNDIIDAGPGEDRIRPRGGIDVITGGDGIDRFIFDSILELDQNTITDLSIGEEFEIRVDDSNTNEIGAVRFGPMGDTLELDLGGDDFSTIEATLNIPNALAYELFLPRLLIEHRFGRTTYSFNFSPQLANVTYDAGTGTLEVTGFGFAANNAGLDIDPTRIEFDNGSLGERYRLVDTPGVERTSANEFTIILSETDKINVNGILNNVGTQDADGKTYRITLLPEAVTAVDIGDVGIANRSDVVVSNVTLPTVTSATYNASTGALVVTGSGFVKAPGNNNDVDLSLITVSGETYSYSGLSTTSYLSPYAVQTATDIEITSETQFTVTILENGFRGVLTANGSQASNNATYNLAFADNWMRGVATSHDISDVSGNGLEVSNAFTYTITSFSNESGDGSEDGSATGTASGGVSMPGYTYQWSNGATTASVTGLIASTYNSVATDAIGLERTAFVTIGVDNASPTLVSPIPDQTAELGSHFQFTISDMAFNDLDGDDLAYSAALSAGGMLPHWLHFDSATRTFSGTPLLSDLGSIDIRVTASDSLGTADDVFTLNILDSVAPSLTIWSTLSSPTSFAKIPVTIFFSEPVVGFTESDLNVSGALVREFYAPEGDNGFATSFTFSLIPTADGGGTITVDVAAGAAQDAANNDNSAASQFAIFFDGTPGLTIQTKGFAVGPFTAVFKFTEPVTDFYINDINLFNGEATNFVKVSAAEYSATITPLTTFKSVTINIPMNAASDSDNIGNMPASKKVLGSYPTGILIPLLLDD